MAEMKTNGMNVMAVTSNTVPAPILSPSPYNSNRGFDNNNNNFNGGNMQYCNRCLRDGHFPNECFRTTAACHGCGEVGHIRLECTRAPAVQCFRCNQSGHIAKDCPSAQPRFETRADIHDYNGSDTRPNFGQAPEEKEYHPKQ